MRRAFTILLSSVSILALLAVAFAFALPGGQAQDGGRRLVLEISDETAKPTQSFEAFDTVQFTVFDFDGDGIKEVLAKNDNNWIYVFDSRTGAIRAEMKDGVWPGWKYRELGGVAVGDVNGNGRWDLVSASSAGILTVWELDPAKSAGGKLHFDKLWEKQVKPELVDPEFRQKNPWTANESTGFDSAPYLADVDGDGKDEIFVQADNLAGQYAFNGKGELMWGKTFDDGNANPWVADLDRDGKLEVVFATDAGRVWVFDAKSGSYKWMFDSRKHGAKPGSISLAPGLIDLDGDGRLEVVYGARVAIEDKSDPEWHLKQHAMVFALSSKGEMLWNKSFEWGEPHVYMWPAAHDVDGDGVDEAIFMDWNTVGHKPGNWETTGPPNLFAINGKGDVLFHTKVSTYWSNKNVLVADIDGDGEQELVVNKGGERDGIAWFGMDGKQEAIMDLPWAASRAPLVTDLYGDGRMHMLVPVAKSRGETNYRDLDVGYRAGKILVYDMGVPFSASWDNVVLFNHKLDHLYGGKAKQDAKPVADVRIEAVEDADAFAVRVTSGAAIERVTARSAGTTAAATDVTREGDVWRAALEGDRFEVTAYLEGGGFVTRTLERKAPASPDGGTSPTPPTGGGTDGGTDGGVTPTPDESTGGTPPPDTDEGRAIPAGAVVGALVAAGIAARVRRGRG